MAITEGLGTTLKVTIAATPTTIPQLTSLTPPQISNTEVNTTALDSTWDTSQSTLPNGGTISGTMNWDPTNATHAYLRTSIGLGTAEVWVVTFPDSGTATEGFSGYLTEFSYGEVSPTGVVTVNFTVRITGTVTHTP